MSNGEILMKVGPHGGSFGWSDSWDDAGQGNVRQIYLRYGKVINSIQTVNELNGGLILLGRHGGEGRNFNMIDLRACESITSVSGFSDIVSGYRTISSIKISTNYSEYGPYGSEKEISTRLPFRFEVVAGKFAGFHGDSNSECMFSIGIYVNTKATSAVGTELNNLPRLTCKE